MRDHPGIRPEVLASGELGKAAQVFRDAGLFAAQPAKGILELRPADMPAVAHILLSVGIHGDETAPIEILARILAALLEKPDRLKSGLLAVVGNPEAIARCRRYVDVDLNRLFRDGTQGDGHVEAARAREIMRACAAFLTRGGTKIHFDLHSAIRASRFPSFAVVPAICGASTIDDISAWLGAAGVEAAVVNGKPAGTFTAYTASAFGAMAATLELGRIGQLGKNDLTPFARVEQALTGLLASGRLEGYAGALPQLFEVDREIVKSSEDFSLAIGDEAENFMPMRRGDLIAREGDRVYCVIHEAEYVLFPNPGVAVGQRAGLMLVRR